MRQIKLYGPMDVYHRRELDRLEKLTKLVKSLDKSLECGKITLKAVEDALEKHAKNLEWLLDGIGKTN